MDIYTFLSLDPEEQAKAVFSEDSLSFRKSDSYNVMLHTVGDFYVEVFYDTKSNEIIEMRPFQSRRLLVPYLDNLIIPDNLNDLI